MQKLYSIFGVLCNKRQIPQSYYIGKLLTICHYRSVPKVTKTLPRHLTDTFKSGVKGQIYIYFAIIQSVVHIFPEISDVVRGTI